MRVNTGFGYLTDAKGNITDKYILPAGDHPLKSGYTQTEVANQAALDLVELYKEPLSEDAEREILIENKKKDLAIAALKTEGKLDGAGKVTPAGKTTASELLTEGTIEQ